MNRADLSWALNAVLPHCGKSEETNCVGLQYSNGLTYAWATDKYTIGIARISELPANIDVRLPKAEATDLMRFVRPSNKGEQIEELSFGRRPGEFHVGYADESEVYTTQDEFPLDLANLMQLIDRMLEAPADWDEAIYQPKLVEKFAKAQRVETDRLRILPRRVSDRNGVAVVSVGRDFLGAIAGLTYDQLGDVMVTDFLNERNAA